MNKDFVLLARYDNPVEANIVKGRLESADIYCFLAGENFVGLNPLYSNMAGGIRLFINPEDYEMASQILKKDMEEYRKQMACEVCGSDQVHYVSTMRDSKNWFAFILAVFFTALPLYIKKVYKCDVCGYETETKE